ncbi:MAG TPA: DEAD/DEAH box helicase [Flavipsychrobacter sp.]|jgi:ATP-dependent RNA helicase RhlE|nr:DEAD/DEAH box helicase [Flavipsychrobacter sp.]
MNFTNLNLVAPLLKALATQGYTTPTPIQAQAIPLILQGKDLIGCAQTGTGKTAAFSLPILQLLSEQKSGPHIKCLVLTPTRELAIQIADSFSAYGKHVSLRTAVVFGGVPQGSQVRALKAGVDILIATPGRLLDLMQQKLVHLNQLSIFVLDEADRMLDMGFIHDVKKVAAVIPVKRQTLLFSATMPKEIQHLANSLLHQPEKVEVTPVSSTAETIEQEVYLVDKKNKKHLLVHLLKEKRINSVIVFTRTKHGADKLAKSLYQSSIKAEAIHGDKTQNARQRALGNFKNGTTKVLVATDIAARGIDIDDLPYVINFDLPEVAETYVHRIGRTGRAGATGTALSFCDVEEKDYLKGIQKLISKQLNVVKEHPFPAEGSGLVTIRLPRNKEVVKRKDAVFAKPEKRGRW